MTKIQSFVHNFQTEGPDEYLKQQIRVYNCLQTHVFCIFVVKVSQVYDLNNGASMWLMMNELQCVTVPCIIIKSCNCDKNHQCYNL